MNIIERHYESLSEPHRSCVLAIRAWILDNHPDMTEEWKYSLPFFYYHKKPFCYLYRDKKTGNPYIGFNRANQIEHPMLDQGDRKKMKVLHINPHEDLLVDSMAEIFSSLKALY